MTRIAHGLVVAAAAAAFACSGGDNNGSTTDTTSTGVAGNREPADTSAQAGQRQTLTGCLLAGGDAGDYVLQVARADIPSGIASSTPANGNESSATFRLVAAGADDIGTHLNKRVSVEGFVQQDNAPVGTSGVQSESNTASKDRSTGAFSNADANRSGTSSAQDNSVSPQEMPLVRAESVKTVAENCSNAPER